MLELPEECPDYDYGLKVVCKEEKPDAAASLAVGRLNGDVTNFQSISCCTFIESTG